MRKNTILIVDDEPLNRLLLEAMLEQLGYNSRSVNGGQEALDSLDEEIDLVLLDINMPKLTGFEVVRRIRSADKYSDIPIIMVTALSSMQDRLEAVEAGANDFICKPVDFAELKVRTAAQLKVKHAQDEVKLHQSELEVRVQERTSALRMANDKLQKLATTDPLTGLANHRSLIALLEEEISISRQSNAEFGVLFIDLDHFKALNDSCGHSVGDGVLTEFGHLLIEQVGERGVAGRWGGEEFVCVLPNASGIEAMRMGEVIRKAVAEHMFQSGAGCHLTCSVGVAVFPHDGKDRTTIAEMADKAMYIAKALGRNQVRIAKDVHVGFDALHSNSLSREDLALAGLVEALANLVRVRDPDTGNHADNVADLSAWIAHGLGLAQEQVNFIRMVGRLHDIGKVATPDCILRKVEPLTAEEWAQMKKHVEIGAQVLERVPSLRMMAPAVRSHHERWDGEGYPDGLAGEAIPLAARIVSVADAYSAMTRERPYHKAVSALEAFEELKRHSGSQFCPKVVGALGDVLMATQAA